MGERTRWIFVDQSEEGPLLPEDQKMSDKDNKVQSLVSSFNAVIA
mgnify:FL=1